MKIIRGLKKPTPFAKTGCVATMGKFDGVHRGHQMLISRVQEIAQKKNLPTLVILFEPYPQEFFHPNEVLARLTRLREKLIYLRELKVDYVLIVQFDAAFACLSAQAFVENLMVGSLGIRHFVVGDDFRFGAKQQGDFGLLKKLAKPYHFEAERLPALFYEGHRVSSSSIRHALAKSDMALAKQLLGRTYSLHGRVGHGQKLGRQLGFPTANIFLHRKKSPVLGIYAVQMHVGDEVFNGVANIGSRPAVQGTYVLLEVYLFDFNQDIYGRYVQVDILHKLRDEAYYDSLDALKAQIQEDVTQTKQYFLSLTHENDKL